MPPTFRDLIAENKRNSVLLVILFCLFTTVVILVLCLGMVAYLAPDVLWNLNWGEALLVGGIAGALSLFIAWIGYLSGSSLVLGVSGAQPLRHQDDPELFNVVEEMAIAAGVPMPRVYLIQDAAPNAFATGRDPQHAAVAITSGLRTKLTRDELQGVIAHEMSHVRNYDIRLMLLLAVLVGTIVMLADLFRQMLWFGPGVRGRGGRSRDRDDRGGGGVLILVLVILALLLALLAPLLAQLIQLAVSRQREYLADASAVELTRYPQGLANALRKIDADPAVLTHANRGTAHLYIANPIRKFADRADTLFSSHPPIKDRIHRLDALAHHFPSTPYGR
jgi:heat shock protein HtpX